MTADEIEERLKVCRSADVGPWHAGTGKAEVIIYAEDGYAIADTKTFHCADRNATANARFIAVTRDPTTGYEAALTELRAAQEHVRNHHAEPCETCIAIESELIAARERIAELESSKPHIEWETISKPGAVIEAKSAPIPEQLKAKIAEALNRENP